MKTGDPNKWQSLNYTGAYENRSQHTMRWVWRYYYGASSSTPLTFGTLSNGSTKTHTNSNRVSPERSAGADNGWASVGYSNSTGSNGPDVWYSFVVSTTSEVTISTDYSKTNYDSYLRLYDNNSTLLASHDDIAGSSNRKSKIVKVLCPGTYKILVDGTGTSNSGDFTLSVKAVNSSAVFGGTIAYNGSSSSSTYQCAAIPLISSTSTAASAAGGITYKWEKFNGTSSYVTINGATSSTYNPPEVMGTSSLYYLRKATDACGRTAYSNIMTFSYTNYNVNAGSIAIAGGETTKDVCSTDPIPIISSVTSASSLNGGISYQWKKGNGSIFEDIAGATSSTYDPPGLVGASNHFYKRKATDACGKTAESASVSILSLNNSADGGSISLDGTVYVEIGNDPGIINSTTDASASPNPIITSWEKREQTGEIWSTWSIIEGENGQSYNLSGISKTTEFRRKIVNDCSGQAYSNVIHIAALPADGIIAGKVTVGNSDIGVKGVQIEAKRTIAVPGGAADEIFITTTADDGTYTISDIYYGPEAGTFLITPTLVNHSITPLDTIITLNAAAKNKTVDFQDECPGGTVSYVNQNAVGGNGSGDSWANAFTDLQEALDFANGCADVTKIIYVAKGIYKPSKKHGGTTERHNTFYINTDIKIYGGFAGGEMSPDQRNIAANPTILNGDLAGNDTHTNGIVENADNILDDDGVTPQDNAYHVVWIDHVTNETLLDGLIITAGYADNGSGLEGRGGGIYNDGSGAGRSSNPNIKNCLLVGNGANYTGGAIFNLAESTGSVNIDYQLTEFRGNKAFQFGGAIFNWNAGGSHNTAIYGCHFIDNYASNGGAMYNFRGSTSVTISHSTFWRNTAASIGGAIHNDNTSGNEGMVLLNTSFYENMPQDLYAYYAKTTIQNSNLWGGSTKGIIATGSPNPYVENSIIRGGHSNGLNIYEEDPSFEPQTLNTGSAIGGYLHLETSCSYAIDKGKNDFVSAIEFDLDGNNRFLDGIPGGQPHETPDGTEKIVDLGPYEYADPFFFGASINESDAWVALTWQLDPDNCECLKEDPNQQKGVAVELYHADGTLLQSWPLLPENWVNTVYTGSYKDYLGPDATQDYRLEIRRIGPGSTNCHQNTTGATSPFLTPVVTASDAEFPDSVVITWENRSWLSDLFRVYRDEDFLGEVSGDNVPGGTFGFSDVYRMNDTTSLVNGETYTYRIETVSNQIGTTAFVLAAKGEDLGSTMPINLQASDNSATDRVLLTWNDMQNYCDQIRIVREGVIIGVVSKSATTFEDLNPLYGQTALYGVELLRNGQPFVGSYDDGSAPPNGIIKGVVLTNESNFPVSGASINLTYDNNGMMVNLSTTSDFAGKFEFIDLYYGLKDTFQLSATLAPAGSFLENPIDVALSLDNAIDSSVVFYELSGYQEGIGLTTLADFTVTPIPTEDRVQLDWNYNPTANKITYFNLYRGSSLLAQLNDNGAPAQMTAFNFTDLTGLPETEYDYRITAFQLENGVAMDTSISVTETFPKVAPVLTLNATPNNNLGVMNLDWSHTSTNFTGFRLYRNGERIYQGKNINFVDVGGRPDSTEAYHITAYRTLNDIDFESVPADTIFKIYPGLPAVTLINVVPKPAQDLVAISWTIPTSLIAEYNYTGFHIYRTDVTSNQSVIIHTIDKFFVEAGQVENIQDRSGIPNTAYKYEVRTFLKTSTVDAEKMGTDITVTFPKVAPPLSLTDGISAGKIKLDWQSPHTSTNYDGFVIYKGSPFDSIGDIGVQYINTFTDFVTNPSQTTQEDYGVAAIRDLEGVRYYSDMVSLTSGPPTPGNSVEDFSSFTASRDQANHIKVCWEWESQAAEWRFVILREGVRIDTVTYTARAYYDYEAPEGVDVEYSVYAYYLDQQETQQLFAVGFVPSGKALSGRIYKRNSGQGLADVTIITKSTSAPLYQHKTKTDAAGYYQITNLPNHPSAYDLTISADTIGKAYEANPQTIAILPSTFDYSVHFVDTFELAPSDMEVAQVMAVTVTAQPEDLSVLVNWSPDTENYTGFEVFRGTSLIGEVLKGNDLEWLDTEGELGAFTLYFVRAFLLDNGEKVYSNFANDGTIYPILEPIRNLTLTPVEDKNKVLIQWSHPYDNHDFYVIERNGIAIAAVNAGDPMIVEDTTGSPGQLYKYTVSARKDAYQSELVSETLQYPVVFYLNTLAVTYPTDANNENSSMNHLELNWSYETDAADKFQVIRYTKETINSQLTKQNEKVIALVDGTERAYKDYTGEPGQKYYYQVLAVLERNDRQFFSIRRENGIYVKEGTLAEIGFASNRLATPNTAKGWLELTFTYPYPTVDSFVVTRAGLTAPIKVIYDADFDGDEEIVFKAIDKNGVPDNTYTYYVKAFSKRNGIRYHKETTFDTISYPKIPQPTLVTATDGVYNNRIEVTWEYDADIAIDGFRLKRKLPGDAYTQLDVEGILPAGRRMLIDGDAELLNLSPDELVGYTVEAYKVFPTESPAQKYSLPTEDNGYIFSGRYSPPITNNSHQLGQSVSMSNFGIQNWAIAGSLGGAAYIYKEVEDGSWVLHQELRPENLSNNQAKAARFGYSVSISGKFAAVGSPYENTRRGAAYIFEYNSNEDSWIQKDRILASSQSTYDQFGFSVDILDATNDYLIVGSPYDDDKATNAGVVHIFKRDVDDWDSENVPASVETANLGEANDVYGYSVAISKAADNSYFAVVGAPDFQGQTHRGKAYILKLDNSNSTPNTWVEEKALNPPHNTVWYNGFGESVDISKNLIIIGESRYVATTLQGGAHIYSYLNSNWNTAPISLTSTIANSYQGLGIAVSIIDGATNKYALLGGAGINSQASEEEAYLLKLINTTWTQQSPVYSIGTGENNNFGQSVAINEFTALVGAPLNDDPERGSNSGTVHFYRTGLFPAKPTNVNATDNGTNNQVIIQWSHSGTNVSQYDILRDGAYIGSTASNDPKSYTDLVTTGIVPGKKHFYQVVAKSSEDRLSAPGGDFGSIRADGTISGKVTAKDGVSPVEGVSLMASGTIDGETFTYGPITNNLDGTYEFTQVYYGGSNDGTYFTVTPAKMVSDFDKPEELANLTITGGNVSPEATQVNFKDNTSYTISGIVRHADIPDCGLEGIEIEYLSVFKNGSTIKNSGLTNPIITDENGAYSFVINPFLDNLDSIVIKAKELLITGNAPNQDTVQFDLTTNGTYEGLQDFTAYPYFVNFAGMAQENSINFYDQTRYEVNLAVRNTCDDALNNNQFSVRATTRDGCFQKEILLNTDGTGQASLPPLDLILTVSDIDEKTTQNLVYLEYLMNSPVSIDLYGLHRDTSRDLSAMEMKDLIAQQFTFHLPPRVVSNFDNLDVICNGTGVVTQKQEYTIPIAVTENFSSGVCPVSEGFLKITNGASNNPKPDTIYYDSESGGFPDYVFTAGSPNVVAPHLWSISIEYFSAAGQFQGIEALGLFVEGEVGIPGNGVMVDAGGGTQEVPLPLYVLRDPPGDASSSSIGEGHTVTKSISWDGDIGGAVSLSSNTSVKVVGVGASINVESSIGGSVGLGRTLDLTTTTTKGFSTSDDENAIGKSGDVIVGAGLAMQYGLKSSFTYEGCDADGISVKEVRRVGLTPKSINTTWVYSVGFVEGLVAGYERDIPLIETGEKIIEENGKPLAASVAATKYKIYRDNWQQVLNYHKRETNPLYYMTHRNFTKSNFFTGGIANEWRDGLLSKLDLDDDGVPKPETFGNPELVAYNNAAWAIQNLLEVDGPISLISALSEFGYAESKLTNSGFAPPEAMAKNYTIEGNAGAVSFSYGQTRSFANTLTTNLYMESSLGGGLSVDQEAQVWLGFGGGVVKTVAEFEQEINATVSASMSLSNTTSKETTVESVVEYTLDDDDPGDDISITILKGIDMNHTPYFHLFAGETSCPPEEGTINRHNPLIQVLNPESDLPGASANRFFQPANESAEFTIRMVNKSPTDDTLGYEVFLDNSSNPDNATVTLSGDVLGTKGFPNQNPNEPQDLTLSISRGSAFDYQGLRVGIRPLECADGAEPQFVTLNVTFVTPCSPVTIVQPDNNWLMNSSNNELVIAIRDYQPDIDILEDFELQYRRIGGSTPTWSQLPYPYLVDQNNPVTKATLSAFNETNFRPGQIPTYYFTWKLPEDRTKFPDGDYEVRVVAKCKEGDLTTKTYSNVVSGSIDRTRLNLFGVPQPSDGYWTSGDLIAAAFNKNVDCGLFDDFDYITQYLKVEVDGTVIPEANFTCFNNEVRITLPDMTIYDGKRMQVTLDSIVDPTGNLAINVAGDSRTIIWDFLIITSKAYWEQDSIVVELYEGETLEIVAGIRNTQLQVPISNIRIEPTTASGNWLSSNPAMFANISSIAAGAVRPITFTITGTTEGVYTDTVKVAGLDGNSVVPKLPVKVVVRKRPPYPPNWEVNANLYPNSMTLITNFQYTGEADYSRDTLDQISVWIGNTQRGLGRIQDAGNGYYVAYITVYGNTNLDQGKPLEFRVWDADVDMEYSGHPDPDNLVYQENIFQGKTNDPIILHIDTAKDLARYIHLNQGWTWFSLNTVEPDMRTPHLLRGLKNPTPGDRILSQTSFAEYISDEIGWLVPEVAGMDTLRELKTDESYMIYLQDQADSLRISGSEAPPIVGQVQLKGWNWIGYPAQTPLSLEAAMQIIPAQNATQLKSKDLARLNTNGNWTDGLLTQMVPNEGYKLNLSNGAVLNIPNPANLRGEKEEEEIATARSGDPEDNTSWTLEGEAFAYQDVIPVVGYANVDGIKLEDRDSKVSFFIDGELRGLGYINFVPAMNTYLFSALVGINEGDLEPDIYFYDATNDIIHPINTVTALTNASGVGLYNYSNPLEINVATPLCDITQLQAGTATPCDSGTNTYAQDIVITYSGTPNSGTFRVNGVEFAITTSPQTVTLPNLPADGQSVAVSVEVLERNSCAMTVADLFTAPQACSTGGGSCTDNQLTINNQVIAPNTYHARQTLTSNGQVETGAVVFKAGQSISLKAGFHAKAGAQFTAQIEACNPLLDQAKASERTKKVVDIVLSDGHDMKVAPNPFFEKTTIQYALNKQNKVHLSIHDASGKQIEVILNGVNQDPGFYEYEFKANNLPIGIYYAILKTETAVISKKMILIQ